jgi:hypothetical protein
LEHTTALLKQAARQQHQMLVGSKGPSAGIARVRKMDYTIKLLKSYFAGGGAW